MTRDVGRGEDAYRPANDHAERTVARLEEAFAALPLSVTRFRHEVTVLVPRDQIRRVCRFLKDDPETDYAMLVDLSGLDRLGETPRFYVIYHLLSLRRNSRLRLKVGVPEGDCSVDTVTDIWQGANFHEREVYDMFGITFAGHPDLRRILTPDDMEGHPLRKDFPLGDIPVTFDRG